MALLSQPPSCLGNLTSFFISIDFGTLAVDLGCFPLGYEPYRLDLTAVHHVSGIRSLIGVGKLVGPLAHSVLYPGTLIQQRLNAFRREPDISEFDWPFTLATTHPLRFQPKWVRTSNSCYRVFILVMARSLSFGSARH